jgi:3-oxoadipate enol-lactonase
MIDRGCGPAVVLIPGMQGRWEWMAPAVDALSERCRVVTYSLCGEPGSGRALDPVLGFDSLTRQLEETLDRVGIERAVLCGISFGGLVGLRFAAERPERTAGLALVSTPGPSWRADARVRRHVRWPRLLAPWFVVTSPLRLIPEITAAFGRRAQAAAFFVRHSARVAAAPLAPTRTAARVRMLMALNAAADCVKVGAPTLVVTGEPALDRVVPANGTCEYIRAIPGAEHVLFERTGHIGLVTRPGRFAEIIAAFAEKALSKNEVRRTKAEVKEGRSSDLLPPSDFVLRS